MSRRLLLVQLLPLSLVMGICLASPAYGNHDHFTLHERVEGKNGNWINGGDNDRSGHEGIKKGPGPAVPEPASWLAMGVGLLVVGRFLRRSS
ncbi:MAG TPA: PEP-CTERM sorting domain-containing protein [Myxococcota bacterium]|nr:PEP-CTERM sorting domain-containing protein [Myxococcota bacterium]